MQIGQCAYVINVKVISDGAAGNIAQLVEMWLEGNNDQFVISMDIQHVLEPTFGIHGIATIVHRQATLKELGVE